MQQSSEISQTQPEQPQSMMQYCISCNHIITCGCQKQEASNGQTVCDFCKDEYEKFIEFHSEVESFVAEKELQDKYCIALYTFININESQMNKQIKHMYRGVEDFKSKAFKQIMAIDRTTGIDFQVCIYE